MARILINYVYLMTTSLLFFFFLTNVVVVAEKLHRDPPPKIRRLLKNEKISHLHFYFHDTTSGPNATVVQVASGASKTNSATGFGDVYVIDDPLTEGPESSSKLVGRAQGMYGFASLNEFGLLMNINFCFVEGGEYNGSTISVLGRNMVLSEVREMPVVGGTGIFRFSRGYVQAKTHSIDRRTAIVEYNAFVIHY